MKRELVLLLTILAVVAAFQTSVALEKVKFGIGAKDNPVYFIPVIAEEQMGIEKKNNLEVEWVLFKSGGDIAAAVAAGHVGIGAVTAQLATQWMARAFPVIIVGAWDLREEWFLWVPTDSPLMKPTDLKGSKMGISRFGGMSEVFPRVVARALGIEKEVKFVAVGGLAEQMAALKAKAVDSIALGILPMAELVNRGEVRPLVRMDDYLPKEWVQRVVIARKDYLKAHPETVRRLIKTILEAFKFVKENPSWTVERLKSATLLSEGAARIVQARFFYSRDGRIERKALENVVNFLDEYGVVSKEKLPPVGQMYTDEYVP